MWVAGRRQGDGAAHACPFSLTVQLYLIQSSQNREAENFFRITTVMPWSRHWPTPTMFPEVRGVWRLRRWRPKPRASSHSGLPLLRVSCSPGWSQTPDYPAWIIGVHYHNQLPVLPLHSTPSNLSPFALFCYSNWSHLFLPSMSPQTCGIKPTHLGLPQACIAAIQPNITALFPGICFL